MQLQVVFFKAKSGSQPVREWRKSLPADNMKTISEDIKTVQYGWPIGMPVVRKIESGLWEVRSSLKNRIARVLFTVEDGYMVLLCFFQPIILQLTLLHGFIKKSLKMPLEDLRLAKERLSRLRGEQ